MSDIGTVVDEFRGDGDDAADDSPLREFVAGTVVALVFLVGFGLLALGEWWFWVAFPVGFAGVLPAALALVKLYESGRDEEGDDAEDALATLRRRYAAGELTEDEFEAKVERLLETETVADARESASSPRGDRESAVEFERP